MRAQPHGYEFREANGSPPTMTGHFAIFDSWTEINSGFEGHFLERIAPGAFSKTIEENGSRMRVLFNHGHDVMGDQVLGKVKHLEEDDVGARYEVELFDGVPQLITDGLRANQYGSSFRFRVMREEVVENPERSEHNPDGIPERTIKEAHVMEFGPVTFPAYAGATAGMRSMTDEYLLERLGYKPDVQGPEREAPAQDDAEEITSSEARRDEPEPEPTTDGSDGQVDPNATLPELEARDAEIGTELQRIDADAGTGILKESEQERWDKLVAEREEVRKQVAAKRKRIEELAKAPVETREEAWTPPNVITRPPERDIYDLSTIRGGYDNPEQAKSELRDRAMRAVERQNYPDLGRMASKEDMQSNIERLLKTVDDDNATLARRVLVTGHPDYESAFWNKLTGRGLTSAQNQALERAALLTATAGYAMPIALDPTVVLTSSGAVNPIRALAHVVQIAGKTWNGVNSAGITASFDAEQAEVSEDTPTLTQPTVTVLKAAAFVPFSIEAEQWSDIRNELTVEMRDAKDVLEAQKFTLGTGTPEPQGFTVGATYLATTAASATIALADLDTLVDALPPRFQPNAAWLANRKFFSRVRQAGRTAGVSDEWAPQREGFPPSLLGAPRYEASDMVGTVTTTNSLIAAYGDFNRGYVIVDRVGMNVEYIPHLFHTSNNRPSGTRGLYAYWMTNAAVRAVEAIRILKIL